MMPMAERWTRSGAAAEGYAEIEQMEGYGKCPVCDRILKVLGGFKCEWCKCRVCEDCIKKYEKKYICLRCAGDLPEEEQERVGNADDLINPVHSAFRRTLLWWTVLVLILLPAFFGSAWYLYAAGQTGAALIVILVLIALAWYWNKEGERWL